MVFTCQRSIYWHLAPNVHLAFSEFTLLGIEGKLADFLTSTRFREEDCCNSTDTRGIDKSDQFGNLLRCSLLEPFLSISTGQFILNS
ncbi:hypothetical protein K7X08_009863 [Anisodus acutangulus]|uniref:Uncharacterized protein n=1 Tax=Anisodus acutangulus TaxID=402998 RepID=A0A9Q1RTZ7_9SOLA|nr:hypothetical protein K7X08_009863 [Anisodus acutangulus]